MDRAEELRRRLELQDKLEAADHAERGGRPDPEKMDPPMPASGPIDYAADGLGRVVSYPYGLLKTGAAGIGGLTNKEDWKQALVGNATPAAEFGKRAGIPDGARMDEVFAWAKGSPFGKMNARDVIGAGLDAAGPGPGLMGKAAGAEAVTARALRAEGLAGRAAQNPWSTVPARAGKAIMSGRPLGSMAEKAGENYYKSAFTKLDDKLMQAGKAPFSPTGMESGVWGRMRTIPEQADKVQKAVGREIGDIEREGGQMGLRGDTSQDLRPSMDMALKQADRNPVTGGREIQPAASMDPSTRAAASRVVDELQREALLNPKPTFNRMVENKQKYANKAGPEYKLDPKHTVRSELDEQIAHDYRTAIEDLADQGRKGMGGELYKANQKYGTLKEAAKTLRSDATSNAARDWMPQKSDLPLGVIGGLAGAVGGGDPLAMGLLLGGGAAASKFARSTMAKTGGGLLMRKLGKSGLLDPAARLGTQQYFNLGNIQRPNPWSLYEQDGENAQ